MLGPNNVKMSIYLFIYYFVYNITYNNNPGQSETYKWGSIKL